MTLACGSTPQLWGWNVRDLPIATTPTGKAAQGKRRNHLRDRLLVTLAVASFLGISVTRYQFAQQTAACQRHKPDRPSLTRRSRAL